LATWFLYKALTSSWSGVQVKSQWQAGLWAIWEAKYPVRRCVSRSDRRVSFRKEGFNDISRSCRDEQLLRALSVQYEHVALGLSFKMVIVCP
jgi:hypothetical protein